MSRKLKIIIGIAGIIALFLVLWPKYASDSSRIVKTPPLAAIFKKEPEYAPVRMIFVGDMMFDRGVRGKVNKYFEGDFNKLFEHLPQIREADIAFGNLEGPISDKGRKVGSIYSFRFDPIIAPVLKDAGFDVVSFANNHVGDWSYAAFIDTLDRLKTAGILYAGAGHTKEEAVRPAIVDVRGTKVGFVGFTDVGPEWIEAGTDKGGILLAKDPEFTSIIENAALETDFLIASFHWGEEYVKHTKRQSDLAHAAIDAGADMVIGHHPHVEQATEWYEGKFIAYSLGNFIFDQYFSPETMQGLTIIATINEDKSVAIEHKIVKLSKDYQPLGLFDYE